MEPSPADRIEVSVVLHAPPDRVWDLLTDPQEFVRLFGMTVSASSIAPGARARGTVTQPASQGFPRELLIEKVEREKALVWSWQPFPAEKSGDDSPASTTLVEFEMRPVGPDTALTLIESGYDRLPPKRRGSALRAKSERWIEVLESIKRTVERA